MSIRKSVYYVFSHQDSFKYHKKIEIAEIRDFFYLLKNEKKQLYKNIIVDYKNVKENKKGEMFCKYEDIMAHGVQRRIISDINILIRKGALPNMRLLSFLIINNALPEIKKYAKKCCEDIHTNTYINFALAFAIIRDKKEAVKILSKMCNNEYLLRWHKMLIKHLGMFDDLINIVEKEENRKNKTCHKLSC